MKKQITRFLLLALTITSVGFLSSCKDYDEERYGQLKLENQSLKEYYDNLQKQVNAIQDSLYKVKSCQCDKNVMEWIKDGYDSAHQPGKDPQTFSEFIVYEINEGITNNIINNENISSVIEEITNQYLGTQGLTKEQVDSTITAAIDGIKKCDGCDGYLKEEAVKGLIAAAIANLAIPTQSDFNSWFDEYIQNHPTTGGLTAAEVNNLIKSYVDANVKSCTCMDPVTMDMVTNWVVKYLTDNNYVTNTTVSSMIADAVQNFVTKTELNNAITELNLAQYATKQELGDIKDSIAVLTSGLENAQADVQEALDWIDANKDNVTYIETLKSIVEKIPETYATKTDVSAVKDSLNLVAGTVDANTIAINSLKEIVDNIDSLYASKSYVDENIASSIEAAKEEFNKIFATKDELKNVNAKVDSLANAVDTLVAQQIKIVNSRIDDTNATVAALEKAYQLADSILNARIDSLKAAVESAGSGAASCDCSEAIKNLSSRIDNLEDARAKQISNIIIQQVYNPMFGTVALPAGVSTNILLGCYGEANKAFAFPNNSYFGVAPILERNAGDILVSNFVENSATNANDSADLGTVYVTVNPTDVDFTGFNGFKLVNSQDVESPIALGNVKKSDVTLHFGYTRAANNGFYETTARVAAKKAASAQAINVDKHAIKDALVELYKTRSKSQIKTTAQDVATTVLKTAKDVLNLDAQGLKASWTDNYGQHSVISQYAVASTTYKPLVFNSFDAITGKQFGNLPGYTKAQNLINKIHDKAISTINRGFNKMNGDALVEGIQGLVINDIQLKELDTALVAKFKVTVRQDINLAGKQLKFGLDKDVDLPITLTTDADISGLKFNIPTIVVKVNGNGTIGSDDPTDTLTAVWVPIIDKVTNEPITDPETGNIIGGYIPATNVTVSGDGTANNVTVVAPDGTKVPITINQTIQTHLKLEDLEITIPESDDFKFSFTQEVDLRDQIKDIFGTVQGQIGGVNDMLQDVRDVVDAANDLIDDINGYHEKINDNVDKYTNKVLEYLDKINNKSVGAINKVLRNADKVLAPAMIVNSDKGLSIAGIRGASTKASGNVTLIATTYNGELLTPCVAKYVTINGVRAQIGKGGKINANLKKGKNVIKYAALDYAGAEIDNTYVIYYE